MNKFLLVCSYIIVILFALALLAALVTGFILEPVVVGIAVGSYGLGVLVSLSIIKVLNHIQGAFK